MTLMCQTILLHGALAPSFDVFYYQSRGYEPMTEKSRNYILRFDGQKTLTKVLLRNHLQKSLTH